jgi:uncharacterized protein YoxC
VFTDGTDGSFIFNRTDKDYLNFIASVDAQCTKISKDRFFWKSGAGDDSPSNWKNFGIPDCSGTSPPPPPPPPQPRECLSNEIPTASNMCVMPMYRWSYAEKKWEKCEGFFQPIIVDASPRSESASSMTRPSDWNKPGYTSCQPMHYDLEVKWKTMKYLAYPPEKFGEWYWPPWDASFERLRYNPEKDELEKCSAQDNEFYAAASPQPDTWWGPCQPVKPEDKEWMLEKYRSEYKIFLIYRDQWRKPGPHPEPGPIPLPEPIPVPLPDPTQCKPYLQSVRQGLVTDKQFWRDVNRRFSEVKSDYPAAKAVRDLLAKAKALIVVINRTARKGSCAEETIDRIRTDLDTLHLEIFSELSGHLTDMEETGELRRCRERLESLASEVNKFMIDADDDEVVQTMRDFAAQIEEKRALFEEESGEFGFESGFECDAFADEIDSQLAPFRIKLDAETERTSQVILEKLGTQVETLTKDLGEKEKKIEELIVQVSELKQAVEKFSKVANVVQENLTISLKALAGIDEKFKEERQQMLAEKNKLTALVGELVSVMQETSCVRRADRDRMATELGDLATINWLPGRSESFEKRLQLIMSSCRAKDFSKEDMASFFASLDEAERQNLLDSFRQGLTPFDDVATDKWYYIAMKKAHENGQMIKGMPGEYALTQDALLMMLRVFGARDITGDCKLSAPGVANVSPYAVCAVNYAHSKGLPLQKDMTQKVERIRIAEWITLLWPNLPNRADSKIELFNSFVDIKDLGNAMRFVAYLSANDIMVGRVGSDGTSRYFDPHASLTRAALAVILEQLQRIASPLIID